MRCLLASLLCLLTAQAAFAQRLMSVDIHGLAHPPGVVAHGHISDDGKASPEQVWAALKGVKFTLTRRVSEMYENPLRPDFDNPLQANYREDVKIVITQAGEVTVKGVRLVRANKTDTNWTIHPDDLIRIAEARQPKQAGDPWVGTYQAFERFSDGLYRPTHRADKVIVTKKDDVYELAFPPQEKKNIRFKIDGKRVDGTPRFLRVPDEAARPVLVSFQDRGTTVLQVTYSFNSLYLIKGEPSKELPVATPILLKLYARLQKDRQPKEDADVKFAKTLAPEVAAKAKAFLAITDDPTIDGRLNKLAKKQKKAAESYSVHAARLEDGYLALRLRCSMPDNDIVLIYDPEKKIVMCAVWYVAQP